MKGKKIKNKRYKVNERIRYPEVRVIDSEGVNLGVINTKQALTQARQTGFDLVVITEGANPPVARILDFNKYLYEQNKKDAQVKAKAKTSETKEFRIRARIDDSAIAIKTKRAREFLEDGNKVKITVTLRGREKAHPEIGEEKITKFLDALDDIAKLEGEVKKASSFMTATLLKK